jgi:signal transduction histidine kinase
MNMLVSGAALLLACSAFAVYELSDFRATLVRSILSQAEITGANSVTALLFNDPATAQNTLSGLSAAPNVMSAAIYSPSGALFAAYTRDGGAGSSPAQIAPPKHPQEYLFTADELILTRVIEFQGKNVGTVRVQSDLTELNYRLLRYAGIVGLVLVMSLMAALVLSDLFQKATARPIVQLAETAQVVSREKKYSVRAPVTQSADEVAVLIAAFNEMLEQIQARDTALQTARDELEMRVERRTEQLEAVNRELESFTYSVAHDLRAPLRHIQGFADALKEECTTTLGPAAAGHVDRIMDSTRRMDHLINDLLGLAQVGRQEMQFRPTLLRNIAEGIVRELVQENPERRIEWHIGDLPVLDCDPALIRVALYNLLSNAVKYTKPRDPAVIEIGSRQMDGKRVIFVRDNGVGFNMKYAHKLFGVFERLHRREEFEGTGVGLAIVQRIIHKHGGRIWAESETGRGATFFFTVDPNALRAQT